MSAHYGWLPDPERPGMVRWWSGEAWLDKWQPGMHPMLSDVPDRSATVATTAIARPAAGWLSDPEHPGFLRWWDGSTWTEHRHPFHAGPGGQRDKSVAVAYVLFFLFGGFAAHRFYLGRPGSAAGFLVLYWLGLAGATVAIEAARVGVDPWSHYGLLLLCFAAATVWLLFDLFRIPAMTREANEYG